MRMASGTLLRPSGTLLLREGWRSLLLLLLGLMGPCQAAGALLVLGSRALLS